MSAEKSRLSETSVAEPKNGSGARDEIGAVLDRDAKGKLNLTHDLNGVTIRCYWDKHYRQYILQLPQLDITRHAGIHDDHFIIGTDDVIARQVFDFAAGLTYREGANSAIAQIFRWSEKHYKKLVSLS